MTTDQEQLRAALKRTAVALKEGDVAFALGGGYAGWALGGPEPEHDVDFVIAERDVHRAKEVLAGAQLRVEHPPEDWLFKAYAGNAMVDLVFRLDGAPVDPALIARAQDTEVLSIRMPVLRATDLLVTKMLALSEHSCDYTGTLPSARALREQVDWREVRQRTEQNPYAAAFLVLLERLGIAQPS